VVFPEQKACYSFQGKKSNFFGFFNYKGSANLTNFARFFFSCSSCLGVGGGILPNFQYHKIEKIKIKSTTFNVDGWHGGNNY
jgi:hypothetical protein